MDSKIWKKSAILIREDFFCQKSGLILKKLMFNFFRKFCWMEVWILLMRRPNWCHKRNIVWKKCCFWTFRIAVFFSNFWSTLCIDMKFSSTSSSSESVEMMMDCQNFRLIFFLSLKRHLVAHSSLCTWWPPQSSRNVDIKGLATFL